ncbi:hypothetical protein [Ligilactobacillus agilis]|nr:hypothetical protein [Ligilactobacillus agilis]
MTKRKIFSFLLTFLVIFCLPMAALADKDSDSSSSSSSSSSSTTATSSSSTNNVTNEWTDALKTLGQDATSYMQKSSSDSDSSTHADDSGSKKPKPVKFADLVKSSTVPVGNLWAFISANTDAVGGSSSKSSTTITYASVLDNNGPGSDSLKQAVRLAHIMQVTGLDHSSTGTTNATHGQLLLGFLMQFSYTVTNSLHELYVFVIQVLNGINVINWLQYGSAKLSDTKYKQLADLLHYLWLAFSNIGFGLLGITIVLTIVFAMLGIRLGQQGGRTTSGSALANGLVGILSKSLLYFIVPLLGLIVYSNMLQYTETLMDDTRYNASDYAVFGTFVNTQDWAYNKNMAIPPALGHKLTATFDSAKVPIITHNDALQINAYAMNDYGLLKLSEDGVQSVGENSTRSNSNKAQAMLSKWRSNSNFDAGSYAGYQMLSKYNRVLKSGKYKDAKLADILMAKEIEGLTNAGAANGSTISTGTTNDAYFYSRTPTGFSDLGMYSYLLTAEAGESKLTLVDTSRINTDVTAPVHSSISLIGSGLLGTSNLVWAAGLMLGIALISVCVTWAIIKALLLSIPSMIGGMTMSAFRSWRGYAQMLGAIAAVAFGTIGSAIWFHLSAGFFIAFSSIFESKLNSKADALAGVISPWFNGNIPHAGELSSVLATQNMYALYNFIFGGILLFLALELVRYRLVLLTLLTSYFQEAVDSFLRAISGHTMNNSVAQSFGALNASGERSAVGKAIGAVGTGAKVAAAVGGMALPFAGAKALGFAGDMKDKATDAKDGFVKSVEKLPGTIGNGLKEFGDGFKDFTDDLLKDTSIGKRGHHKHGSSSNSSHGKHGQSTNKNNSANLSKAAYHPQSSQPVTGGAGQGQMGQSASGLGRPQASSNANSQLSQLANHKQGQQSKSNSRQNSQATGATNAKKLSSADLEQMANNANGDVTNPYTDTSNSTGVDTDVSNLTDSKVAPVTDANTEHDFGVDDGLMQNADTGNEDSLANSQLDTGLSSEDINGLSNDDINPVTADSQAQSEDQQHQRANQNQERHRADSKKQATSNHSQRVSQQGHSASSTSRVSSLTTGNDIQSAVAAQSTVQGLQGTNTNSHSNRSVASATTGSVSPVTTLGGQGQAVGTGQAQSDITSPFQNTRLGANTVESRLVNQSVGDVVSQGVDVGTPSQTISVGDNQVQIDGNSPFRDTSLAGTGTSVGSVLASQGVVDSPVVSTGIDGNSSTVGMLNQSVGTGSQSAVSVSGINSVGQVSNTGVVSSQSVGDVGQTSSYTTMPGQTITVGDSQVQIDSNSPFQNTSLGNSTIGSTLASQSNGVSSVGTTGVGNPQLASMGTGSSVQGQTAVPGTQQRIVRTRNHTLVAGNSAGPVAVGPVVNTMSSVNAAAGHTVTQMMPVQGTSTADLMSSVPVGGVPVDNGIIGTTDAVIDISSNMPALRTALDKAESANSVMQTAPDNEVLVLGASSANQAVADLQDTVVSAWSRQDANEVLPSGTIISGANTVSLGSASQQFADLSAANNKVSSAVATYGKTSSQATQARTMLKQAQQVAVSKGIAPYVVRSAEKVNAVNDALVKSEFALRHGKWSLAEQEAISKLDLDSFDMKL